MVFTDLGTCTVTSPYGMGMALYTHDLVST
jgi:hypothetical protein